ncbi:hypothetical protein HN604_00480 [archaeon]|jgi:hypothetical protein|nr:hypothetical protein [archaeon]MBT6182986.1 hypothetical protein [archaeon]MBT6606643.1 hypothetical protein [archaeon]MBT7251886.1 hypothetical protein [archaeon]MBT7660542.1 hypothetical protein [archaeon]
MGFKEVWKKNKFLILGIFFTLLQILVIYRNLSEAFNIFFWLCDFIPIIIAIGFFRKNLLLVRGVVSVAFLPQMVYLVSLVLGTFIYPNLPNFSYLIEAFGFLNFLPKGGFYIFITILTHLSTLFAMMVVINYDHHKKSLKYSALLILGTFFASFLFTSPIDNINYVFTFGQTVWPAILWTLIVFFAITIPTYYLQKLIHIILIRSKYFEKKDKSKSL